MKTAVSIPNDIYLRAERLARRTKRTRSRVFGDALITAQIGRLSPSKLDLILAGIDVVLGR